METYVLPIKVIVVGAVHIAQYLVDFAKSLNFEISIIDPRGYFASEQRFPDMKIINKWPDEAFKEIETNENTALVALTHDPKIDDPALQHALKKKFYYIGALGSKKTHENRCQRLKEAGFSDEQIKSIFDDIAYSDNKDEELQEAIRLFAVYRGMVLTGYFTSEIGIKDLGYKGNTPNVWDGVPEEILKDYSVSYDEDWISRCVDQSKRNDLAEWDEDGNLLT